MSSQISRTGEISLSPWASICISQGFYFSIFSCFDIMWPCWPWRDWPSCGVSQFLERQQTTHLGNELFTCRPTNPEPFLQSLLLLGSCTLGYYCPVPKTPEPGIRQTRIATMPQSHWNYSNYPILNLLTLFHQFLSTETAFYCTIKYSLYHNCHFVSVILSVF